MKFGGTDSAKRFLSFVKFWVIEWLLTSYLILQSYGDDGNDFPNGSKRSLTDHYTAADQPVLALPLNAEHEAVK